MKKKFNILINYEIKCLEKICVSHSNLYNSELNVNYTKFALKYGKNLKAVYLNDENILHTQQIFRHTPNVQDVQCHYSSSFVDSNQSRLTKLKSVFIYESFSLKLLQHFTDIYCEQITRIGFVFNYKHFKNDDFNKALIQFSRFKGVVKLELDFDFVSDKDLLISHELSLISKCCLKLKYLSFLGHFYKIKTDILQMLSGFLTLDSLKIKIESNPWKISDLQKLKCLKRISITYSGICDEQFKGIHLYLPKINEIHLSAKICESVLHDLAKLQYLFKLKFYNKTAPPEWVCYFLMNSKSIRSFNMEGVCYDANDNKSISQYIEACIECADKKPKIIHLFKISFNCEIVENFSIYKTLNKNLWINSFNI